MKIENKSSAARRSSSDRSAQQAAEEAVQALRALRRKGVRTYLGLWGLAIDRVVNGALTVAQQGMQFSQRVEARGEAVEQTVRAQLSGLEQQAITGLIWLRDRIDEQLPPSTPTSTTVTIPISPALPNEPAPPGIASGRVLIDNAEARRTLAPVPQANYDQLMAKQVIDQLARLTVDELNAVQAYEQQHGARITVLRAIDQTIRRKLAFL